MQKIKFIFLLSILFLLNSCAVVGGIFKAGVWVGVLIVLFVLGLIIWVLTRGRK